MLIIAEEGYDEMKTVRMSSFHRFEAPESWFPENESVFGNIVIDLNGDTTLGS